MVRPLSHVICNPAVLRSWLQTGPPPMCCFNVRVSSRLRAKNARVTRKAANELHFHSSKTHNTETPLLATDFLVGQKAAVQCWLIRGLEPSTQMQKIPFSTDAKSSSTVQRVVSEISARSCTLIHAWNVGLEDAIDTSSHSCLKPPISWGSDIHQPVGSRGFLEGPVRHPRVTRVAC